MLFRHLLAPGDRVSSSSRPTTARCCCCSRLGAELVGGPLEADGVDVGGGRGGARRRARSKLAHVIPNFHNPAGCTLSAREATRASSSSPPSTASGSSRTTPTALIRFERRGAADDARDGRRRRGSIHASSFSKTVSPGVRVGYLVGPAERDRDARQAGRTRPTSRRTCWPSRSSSSSAARAALDENIEVVNAALRERRDALVEALGEQIPEAEFVVPEGGYFLWLDLDRGRRHRRRCCAEAKERGRHLRRRPRLHDRGRRLEPAPLLRPRPGGRRRRGRPAPRARPGAHCAPAAGRRRSRLDPVARGSRGPAGRGSGPRPASGRACASARSCGPRSPWRSTTSRRSAMFRSVIRCVSVLASISFPCLLSDLLDYARMET